ncbi:hypothetical protein [Photobacterium sanguinicancri]|nr:hypothetical protein [Photobacterium sanguinicancri]MDO6499259.1 hypothetical protein [Photobacterium sanguinicancri]
MIVPKARSGFHRKGWLSGWMDVNPMAEKLLLIRVRGYLPI